MIKLICALIVFSFSCLAKPNVVLLTSLDTPRIWYHKKDWRVESTLRKIFWNRFKKSGYNIVFKDRVDQETLRAELKNPNNIALFWVSHSKDAQVISDGLSSDSSIIDFYGNDVRDLFKDVHPNLRFLGLVGCNAKGIIKKFKEEGNYDNNPVLKIHAFDKKVDARIGLRKSVKATKRHLGSLDKRGLLPDRVYSTPRVLNAFDENKACEKKTLVYPISITRTLTKDAPAAAVKIKDTILDIFPAGKAGETQSLETFIDVDLIKTKIDLKITFDSNRYASMDKIYLGELDFSVSWDAQWKLFAKRDGTPLGVTKNLYRYRGDLPTKEASKLVQIYQCL